MSVTLTQGVLLYEAYQVNRVRDSISWMIKRTKKKQGAGIADECIADESLIEIATDDPQAAIQAAIERGSWA